MALLIDASTPAIKGQIGSASTVVSNSFSPPAGSVIFAYISIDQAATPPTVSSMTDSLGSHLTWAKRTAISSSDTRGEIWWAYCPSAQTNMTATVNFSAAARDCTISIIVFTGGDPDQSTGAVGSSISASGTPSANLTTTRNGSWVIGLVTDFSNNDTPTIPGGQTDVYNGLTLKFDYGAAGSEATWTQGNSATTATSGTSVTINDTFPTAAEYSMAIAEVLPLVVSTVSVAPTLMPLLPKLTFMRPGGFPFTFQLPSGSVSANAWVQNLADTITLSDAVAKAVGPSKADTLMLSDAVAKAIGPSKADTTTLSDVFSRTVVFTRSQTDTITLSDALAKAVGAPLADTITLTDAVAKAMVSAKADTITLSDAIAKAFGSNKADSITLSDALVKSMGIAKSDTITLSDVITPLLNPGSGANYTLNLSDSIVLTEAIVKSMAVSKADQLALADSIVEALNGTWILGSVAQSLHRIIMGRFGIY